MRFGRRRRICDQGSAMRNTILMLLLAVVSGNAMAEWFFIEGNEKQKAYADPATILKTDNKVKMWSMIDLKETAKLSDGKQFLSWKTQYEFDCKMRKFRMLAASMHSKNMGEGEVTNSLDFESPKWEAVPPDSEGEILWKFACKTRYQSEQEAQKHCPGDIVAWINLSTGAVHYKGQRWFGRTKSGEYVCKKEAALEISR